MGAGKVVVVEPGCELLIAFFGVGVVADISPLAKSGLDKAFGLAVGAGSVRAVSYTHLCRLPPRLVAQE